MKTEGGTYLTHVLNGTQSERCLPTRPHHLHYLSMSWYLQYSRSTNLSFLNFFANAKFPNDVLADLTPILTA